MTAERRILVLGYGNPGRLDDGLGAKFAERLDEMAIPGVTVDANYQLNVEDAPVVARHDVVVFADADVSVNQPFVLRPVVAAEKSCFTTHHVDPAQVMLLARDLFGADTKGFLLGIRGYEFNGFGEWLSDQAQENLDEALRFFVKLIIDNGDFEAACREACAPAGEVSCSRQGEG